MAIKLTVGQDGMRTYTCDSAEDLVALHEVLDHRQVSPSRPTAAQPTSPSEHERQGNGLRGLAATAFRVIRDAGDDGIINAPLAQRLGIGIKSLPSVFLELRRQVHEHGERFDQLVRSDRPNIDGARPRRFTITPRGRRVAAQLLQE